MFAMNAMPSITLRNVPEEGHRALRVLAARVVEWVDAQVVQTLYLSAITVAELRFGIASLPVGRRSAGHSYKTSDSKTDLK